VSRVLVIGAGHNGLVAGVILARAGLDVTVVEAASEPGGCIWTETLPSGHRLERGAVEHSAIAALASDLGLQRHGLKYVSRPVITAAAYGDGEVRQFSRSVEETVADLGSDGAAYAVLVALATRLFALLDAFPEPPTLTTLAAGLRGMHGGDELFRLMISSADAVLERRLDDPYLRGALAMYGAHGQMPPWAAGTGMFALLLPAAHDERPARPIGGSRALIAALIAALEAAGGTLSIGTPVHTLRSHGAGARVELSGGAVTHVDTVVSTLDIARTVRLLDDPPAAMVEAARAVGSGRLNVAELKVDLAFDRLPALGPLDRAPDAIWLLQPDPQALGRGFGDIVAGRLPRRPALMWTSPSAHDPSATPDGGGVGWLSTFVPLRLIDGPWTAAREQEAAMQVLGTVEQITGVDLHAAASVTVVTGPATWAQRLSSADGNPNHLDLSLDQLLGWRPPGMAGHRTPLPWLYLSGAGTHPGGGLSGLAGRRAAEAVLDARRGRRRRARRRSELSSMVSGWRLYRSMRRVPIGG
jgi:phytoene dehydrogenase-like protein